MSSLPPKRPAGLPPALAKRRSMDPKLIVVAGRASTDEIKISLPLTIGRLAGMGLCIPHASVSRRHCDIRRHDDYLWVKDHGSSNGTFVNGQRVSEAVIRPGDRLSIGPLTFIVEYEQRGLVSPRAQAKKIAELAKGPTGETAPNESPVAPPQARPAPSAPVNAPRAPAATAPAAPAISPSPSPNIPPAQSPARPVPGAPAGGPPRPRRPGGGPGSLLSADGDSGLHESTKIVSQAELEVESDLLNEIQVEASPHDGHSDDGVLDDDSPSSEAGSDDTILVDSLEDASDVNPRIDISTAIEPPVESAELAEIADEAVPATLEGLRALTGEIETLKRQMVEHCQAVLMTAQVVSRKVQSLVEHIEEHPNLVAPSKPAAELETEPVAADQSGLETLDEDESEEVATEMPAVADLPSTSGALTPDRLKVVQLEQAVRYYISKNRLQNPKYYDQMQSMLEATMASSSTPRDQLANTLEVMLEKLQSGGKS